MSRAKENGLGVYFRCFCRCKIGDLQFRTHCFSEIFSATKQNILVYYEDSRDYLLGFEIENFDFFFLYLLIYHTQQN